jgi:hypothetical protein
VSVKNRVAVRAAVLTLFVDVRDWRVFSRITKIALCHPSGDGGRQLCFDIHWAEATVGSEPAQ